MGSFFFPQMFLNHCWLNVQVLNLQIPMANKVFYILLHKLKNIYFLNCVCVPNAKVNSSCEPSDIVAQLRSHGKAVHILYHWTISPAKFYLEKLIHSHGSKSIKKSMIEHIPIWPVFHANKKHTKAVLPELHMFCLEHKSLFHPAMRASLASLQDITTLCSTRPIQFSFYILSSWFSG